MPRSAHVTVTVDLSRVRANALAVKRASGVRVIAVVKADAYGLGAAAVAAAVRDVADAFYVFDLAEAVAANLAALGKEAIALLDEPHDAATYRRHGVRPVVWTVARAAALADARPLLSVDTGQQRFACPAGDVDAVLAAGRVTEAFTHASTAAQVRRLLDAAGGRGLALHAAGTALLHDPAARLDAVRPGLALYRGAARVTARLADARDTTGPAGYSGFSPATGRHGVVLAGYAHGLRPGPCAVNGHRRRVLEVGMQSAFVEVAPSDKVGDQVVLLGDTVTEADV
ncbi:MAG TPA: alanine racemase, partial [Tepidisphaeraceae bacterium]|nr:alanine racemase [Tepidisphaeraceae bacterium]